MSLLRILITASILFFPALVYGQIPNEGTKGREAARSVLRRVIGNKADQIILRPLNGSIYFSDEYWLTALNGIVTIRGNNAISLCRGMYDYLRNDCHCMFTWEGEHMDLPARWPDVEIHGGSLYELRQYYNVCTFGYTTAYWDWPQWQHEIDWMALHGINMPLAEVGTEAIWRRVWLSMGMTQKELDGYFTGPAFFPWHRMGNIDAWDGPTPESFWDKQIALEKKIVGRMRELGMMPVAPAFAGFVPAAILRVHPEVKITRLAAWAQFPDAYRTYMLDPTSPLYTEIGKRFIREWEKEFGQNKYFLADSFNELKVPVPADRAGRLKMLATYGDAVYRSIIAGEPKATWVMQGWLFLGNFWDKESTAALLSKVPDDRMIVLDLAVDKRPIWSEQDAFYGKQWIYSILHNMGGKTTLGGVLQFFASDAARTAVAPKHGNLVGFGLAPEGIENNEVVYELLTDAMWTAGAIDLNTWLPNYCEARYGACPQAMKEAWGLFCKSCYAQNVMGARAGYMFRPQDKHTPWANAPNDSVDFQRGVQLFLQCAPDLGKNKLYRADAMELTGQYVGSRVDALLLAASAAHRAGNVVARDRSGGKALKLMADMDAMLADQPVDRLDRWVKFARAWGDTPAEKDYYEMDAKRQITTWGGPELTEYASRAWNGMIGGYYRERWKLFLSQWATGKPFDIRAWEENWIRTPSRFPSTTREDSLSACNHLIAEANK